MSGKTITRADLALALHERIGLSKAESAEMVDMLIEEIASHLADGENVKLSSFGSFLVRQKSGRIGRNPKTKVEVPIPPRKVMVFKPSHILKEKVKQGAKNSLR